MEEGIRAGGDTVDTRRSLGWAALRPGRTSGVPVRSAISASAVLANQVQAASSAP